MSVTGEMNALIAFFAINALSIVAAAVVVTQASAPIDRLEILERMHADTRRRATRRTFARMSMNIPKSGYLQSLRFDVTTYIMEESKRGREV